MLKFALKYRLAIDAITADKAYKLRKFELDDEEWAIITELNTVLEVSGSIVTSQLFFPLIANLSTAQKFEQATLFFSQDTVFTIANVIPSMDRLDDILNPKVTARDCLWRWYLNIRPATRHEVYELAIGHDLGGAHALGQPSDEVSTAIHH